MKYISILRHGKAERPDGYSSDKVRPLTARGLKDAALMGGVLARLDPSPDWLISSPALRTEQTTARVLIHLDLKRPVIWEEAVYAASAETLLQVLSQVPPEVDHAVLVGHNPGMHELVSGLCTGAPDRLSLTMATGSLACLELEIVWWNQIRWGCGALELLLKPKVLRE